MSTFTLKVIAIITMLIDHTGAIFNINYFRMIGRIAFPIFAFLIARGCIYTSNIKKYMLRLLIFAFISEIPFNMMINTVFFNEPLNIINLNYQNIFFTLFLGCLLIYIYSNILNKLKDKNNNFNANYLLILLICSFSISYFGDFIHSDYRSMGIILIFLHYIFKEKSALITIIFCFITYNPIVYKDNFFLVSIISALFIFLYNEKKGYSLNKWLFYIFYPLHIFILILIYTFLH